MIAISKFLFAEYLIVELSNSYEMHHFHDSCQHKRYHFSSHYKELISIVKFEIDKKNRIARNIRFMIWGLFFGVVAHGYLVLMNTLFPSRAFFYIIVKVVIDQVRPFSTLFTVVYMGSFFQCLVFLLHFSFGSNVSWNRNELQDPWNQPHAGILSIRQNIVPTMKMNYIVWLPVQAINFLLVPLNV